jgi:hypothetical protein
MAQKKRTGLPFRTLLKKRYKEIQKRKKQKEKK